MKIIISLFLITCASSVWINSIDQVFEWKLFEDSSAGYSIKYPSGWVIKTGKGGFYCGKKGGFENAEWSMWLGETSDAERMEMFDDEELTEDQKEIKNPIVINGESGFHSVITSSKRPGEYYEMIVIKTKSVWYKIENNGIKDDNFKLFYQSFKIIKK